MTKPNGRLELNVSRFVRKRIDYDLKESAYGNYDCSGLHYNYNNLFRPFIRTKRTATDIPIIYRDELQKSVRKTPTRHLEKHLQKL